MKKTPVRRRDPGEANPITPYWCPLIGTTRPAARVHCACGVSVTVTVDDLKGGVTVKPITCQGCQIVWRPEMVGWTDLKWVRVSYVGGGPRDGAVEMYIDPPTSSGTVRVFEAGMENAAGYVHQYEMKRDVDGWIFRYGGMTSCRQ